jgi:hypothetical protein
MKKDTKIYLYVLIFIIIYYLIIPKGYIWWYRGLPFYPKNSDEIKEVQYYVNNRSKEDEMFFRLTNIHIVPAYKQFVDEDYNTLLKICTELNPFCLFLKYLFNRARPKQIDKNLDVLRDYGSADTPAFPAGHAIAAYYLSKVLIKKYPEKREILEKLTYHCDLTRVKAGLHYPSDGLFSKYLVDTFF